MVAPVFLVTHVAMRPHPARLQFGIDLSFFRTETWFQFFCLGPYAKRVPALCFSKVF